ncbi:hypothetical protein CABS01_15268 [Colletotrichum abscissum]|uniref:uncharacterized protein n=1 Tax=Colletotrichum abscissum TaxID=1671311 RepID=UPI0027D54F44|nr:uncharacterized protein CABS01_15268 [Colletotrichum abscissum]KAI3540967.1 hypothetical protein CSPX01_07871 [Colletotrichum filicis]KAK1476733.1 hypothetical protein CABS01_15268 [Colletotrichum abscissum]
MATQLGRTLSREWVLNIATLIQVVSFTSFSVPTLLDTPWSLPCRSPRMPSLQMDNVWKCKEGL